VAAVDLFEETALDALKDQLVAIVTETIQPAYIPL
jgi:hypothetical protein